MFQPETVKIITDIRQAKEIYYKKFLSNNLKTATQTSSSWWSCFKSKSFINRKSSTASSISPLRVGDLLAEDEKSKVYVLNNFFRDQTLLDETNVPTLQDYGNSIHSLSAINVTPNEVKQVSESLSHGKASGQDGINNKTLREL